jgi:hypothetical protein
MCADTGWNQKKWEEKMNSPPIPNLIGRSGERCRMRKRVTAYFFLAGFLAAAFFGAAFLAGFLAASFLTGAFLAVFFTGI